LQIKENCLANVAFEPHYMVRNAIRWMGIWHWRDSLLPLLESRAGRILQY